MWNPYGFVYEKLAENQFEEKGCMMIKNEKALTLKQKLTFRIEMMIAGNLDRWESKGLIQTNHEEGEALAHGEGLLAEEIARKLIDQMADCSHKLPERTWSRMVDRAARNAFVEVPDGLSVEVATNLSFIAAVA